VTAKYRIELLGKHHKRTQFSCGNDELDRYFRERAAQDQRRGVAVVYVVVELTGGEIAGYHTLSAAAVETAGLPPDAFKNLPRYPALPATLLGRLARDLRFRGAGTGRYLLVDALARSLRGSREIASIGVIVDSIDDSARLFYERFGFTRFLEQPYRLILPMPTIEQLVLDATNSAKTEAIE
jgi:GNAT superfamily N-acetyltransferase